MSEVDVVNANSAVNEENNQVNALLIILQQHELEEPGQCARNI